MKKLLLPFLFILLSTISHGQLLNIQSKDSLNNLPKKSMFITAWLKMNGIMDVRGISTTASLSLPAIPTDGSPPDPHFTMDMYQTRIIMGSTFQTDKLGEIVSYIETDFYGSGGGNLRLRHAYIRFLNFRVGQTWSGFTDEEAWPNITDFDGPATGAWVRNPQVAYFVRPSKNQDILFSIELPSTDYSRYLFVDSTLQTANQSFPDLVSHYELRWPRGHFQAGVVYRNLKYKNTNDEIKFTPGWGINLSGSQIIGKNDKFVYQGLVGEGVSRYLVSFGGSGWDAIPDLNGNLIANPVWGGYAGFQHYWNTKLNLSSTFVYGYAEIRNQLGTPTDKLFSGSYMSGNVYWNVVGPLNFAVEVIYGNRRDEIDRFGEDVRAQFVFEYNF